LSREVTNLLYLITIVTFILALRFLSNPATARRGNQIGAAGMLVAIVVTFLQKGINSYWEIIVGMIVGGAFGAVAARKVRMTAMPQMVALFNGVGGGAAALISLAEFHLHAPDPGTLKVDISSSIVFSAIIGSISFSGSMVAFAKLQELIRGRPITYPLQQVVNGLLFAALLAAGIAIAAGAEQQWLIWALLAGAALFGILFVLPIGGADMPVVISLLNALTGLATAATGFELENNVLIVSGMLVGASGTFLTIMMGRAMNRSIANVLFGAFGQLAPSTAGAGAGGDTDGEVRSTTADDVAVMLGYANKVVFVPGYGMAVAQGPTRRACSRRPAGGTGRRRVVRDPPRRRTDAGPHERPACGGECSLSAAEGDGRRERGVLAHRRGARDRRERRRQSRRPQQRREPDLRHAHPQRR